MTTVNFWKNKQVFMTGHTGFKGSWLALRLGALGARVTGYSLAPPTSPSLFEQAKGADAVACHLEGDIRDFDALCKALDAANPEIVFHLAAQPMARGSYSYPLETYAVNAMGTVHLLEAVRNVSSVRAVVCVTSDKCYENREWDWSYRENEPMGGADPYSSSKGCAELIVSAYRRSFFQAERHQDHGVAIASARSGNVIGGGDHAQNRLLPDLVRAIRRGERPVLRNPRSVSPWQHVLDPLSGYLSLAERLTQKDGADFADAWNFGPAPEDARPDCDVAERLLRLWGRNPGWTPEQGEHPPEADPLTLDSAKARRRLGWKPRWNLDAALQEIISFAKADMAGANLQETILRHIALYQRGLSCAPHSAP